MLKVRFTPSWQLTIFTMVMLPLMWRLGYWQLDREQEKIDLQAMYDERANMEPVTWQNLSQISEEDSLQYLPVILTGQYDAEKSFLLDNRIVEGRVGFEVITPFLTETQVFFVNRGWVPMGRRREDIPEIMTPQDEVDLQATIYIPLGETIMLGDETPFNAWPRVLQSLDTVRMASESGYANHYPYILRLEEGMPGVLTRHWPTVNTDPQKHRGYAVQWFAMAGMLLCLYLYAGFRREEK
jgi:surfeit locus 1 family protein